MWFNTLLQKIFAGVKNTSEKKGLASGLDGMVKKATQDDRMALDARMSWERKRCDFKDD